MQTNLRLTTPSADMPRSIKLPFIPSSLRKLREIAGCTEEEAAKRVRKDVELIRMWESDDYEELPTYAQANQLSKLYRYDVLMCMSEIPAHIRPPEMPDFRTLDRNGAIASDFSRNLRWLLRVMEIRQEFIREFGPYWELPHQDWVGSESIDSIDSDELAHKMRAVLGVNVSSQRGFRSNSDALKSWIEVLNARSGVFVCQTSNQGGNGIELQEMRGLSLADPTAPFIVINSKDSEAGRIFTLFHELTHLWIGRTGLSGSEGLQARTARDAKNQVEAFCDETAANVLMPEVAFDTRWHELSGGNPRTTVQRLAREFRVSRDAVAVKAAKLSLIPWSKYAQLQEESRRAPRSGVQRGGGGGNHYLTHIRNTGARYVNLVLGTWLGGEIGIKEAAYFLHVRPLQTYRLARAAGFEI